MTTEQFYQIASCAYIIQDLASQAAEESNVIRVVNENISFNKKNNISCDVEFSRLKKYESAKAKIEERIKAKNEEFQRLINKQLIPSLALDEIRFTIKEDEYSLFMIAHKAIKTTGKIFYHHELGYVLKKNGKELLSSEIDNFLLSTIINLGFKARKD